jgi:preprotein translocase subunit SecD
VPPSTTTSRPWRYLAALAVLLVLMLAGVLQGNIVHPARWHDSFKVGLGLDLSSGTAITLKATPLTGHSQPTPGQMTEAKNIMEDRVNGDGFSGSQVQQQGTDFLTVSVPGQTAQKVAGLVGTTALLRFRQVLLCTGEGTSCLPASDFKTTTTPSASPSASASTPASPSTSASPSASSTAKANASPSPSTGSGQAAGATKLGSAAAAQQAASSASPKASTSAKASSSASPKASTSASPTPTSSASTPATVPTTGSASLVKPATMKLFDKLNCADKNWQAKIYGTDANAWDDVNSQIVSCDPQGVKYVLATSPVTGTELTTASATLDSTNNQWDVDFTLNGAGTKAMATLTTGMISKYFDSSTGAETSVLDQFAIVLDGKVVSAPYNSSAITGGSGTISGGGSNGFTQASASKLANVLKYGHLPLTFSTQNINSISSELGTAQLHAGLVAALIGLLLVVIYSFLYYRGLGLVSVSSLAIAALTSYLAVVLLSKYQHFTLSLDGVAGLIVAIGITADSFVVYFERLRDEVREGRSLRAAVERGWGRARRTILVSDTVSFLAAALLYLIAIGDVKGFAYTLGLTTLIDVVVVFLFTKPMVTLLARTKFFGQGHKLSGLDPARLGARSPWRGSRRPAARPAAGGAAGATSAVSARTTTKEA